MKTLLSSFLLFFALNIHSFAQTVDYSKYNLVWSDEFDRAGRPDSTKWNYEYGFERNHEFQWYQPENAYCEDGLLKIVGKREQIRNTRYKTDSKDWRHNREYASYSSACLITKNLHSWQYGQFEIRAKIPAVKGSWPAIWFLGYGKVKSWPLCGEIDLMEHYPIKGVPTILANAVWGDHIWDSSYTPLSHFTEKDKNWADKFHIWRMDWTEEYIRLYVDDELLNEIDVTKTINPDGFNPFKQPHYLLINLAIGGDNGGDPSGTDFPIVYEVDYVRIYQKK